MQLVRFFLRAGNEEESRKGIAALDLFTFLGVVNIAFGIVMIATQRGATPFELNPYVALGVVLLYTLIWVVAYVFLYNLSAWLTYQPALFDRVSTSLLQVFRLCSLLGLLFNVVLIFCPVSWHSTVHVLAIGLMLLLLLRRLVQLSVMSLQAGVSAWYLILYLCALEIVPLLCVSKLALQ